MIVGSKPETDLDQADLAWFESDAPDNVTAAREIDAEAAKHGLVRTREYWLPIQRLADGRVVRRGICYRPAPSDLAERALKRRGEQIAGPSSAEIVRSLRDGA